MAIPRDTSNYSTYDPFALCSCNECRRRGVMTKVYSGESCPTCAERARSAGFHCAAIVVVERTSDLPMGVDGEYRFVTSTDEMYVYDSGQWRLISSMGRTFPEIRARVDEDLRALTPPTPSTEVTRRPICCGGCGASVSPSAERCEYCGAWLK